MDDFMDKLLAQVSQAAENPESVPLAVPESKTEYKSEAVEEVKQAEIKPEAGNIYRFAQPLAKVDMPETEEKPETKVVPNVPTKRAVRFDDVSNLPDAKAGLNPTGEPVSATFGELPGKAALAKEVEISNRLDELMKQKENGSSDVKTVASVSMNDEMKDEMYKIVHSEVVKSVQNNETVLKEAVVPVVEEVHKTSSLKGLLIVAIILMALNLVGTVLLLLHIFFLMI